MINISKESPLTLICYAVTFIFIIAVMPVVSDASAGLINKTHAPEVPDTALNVVADVEEHIKYNLGLMGYEVEECVVSMTQTDRKVFGHVASYVFIGMVACKSNDPEDLFEIFAPSTVGVEIHDDGLIRISWKPDTLYFSEK